jgi:hypothetical protein
LSVRLRRSAQGTERERAVRLRHRGGQVVDVEHPGVQDLAAVEGEIR